MEEKKRQQTVELATALLLSLGGAATTYCSYQATVWGGRQATAYNRSERVRTDSAKTGSRAGQLVLVDVSTFVAWLQADLGKDPALERAIRDRLRPEFRPAFNDWLKTDPLHNPDAPATPFVMPSYRSAEREESDALAREADQLFADGQYANAQADQYVLATVVFALAIFFAGVGHLFGRLGVQLTMMAVSTCLLVLGISRFAHLPHAVPERAPTHVPKVEQGNS